MVLNPIRFSTTLKHYHLNFKPSTKIRYLNSSFCLQRSGRNKGNKYRDVETLQPSLVREITPQEHTFYYISFTQWQHKNNCHMKEIGVNTLKNG